MRETHTIVVPIDFSEITDQLVEYAVYMADKLSAVIHFVHVVHFQVGDSMLGFSYVQDGEERLQTLAKKRMSDILSANKERCAECTGEVIIGDPVDTIVDFAYEKDADMLIISTHGAKGLEKILLGSVAERVLKQAHCPVLFLNPHKRN